MKKNNIQESLDRMKLLMEYSFKSNSSEAVEENPVKFNEIGDKYKPKPNSDYPSFEDYKDAVILDEESPEEEQNPPIDNTQQQAPMATEPTQSVDQPPVAPSMDNSQQVAPPVDNNQVQPTQDISQQVPMDQTQQQMPATEPQQSFVPTSGYDSDLDNKLNDQMNKTNELLAKFNEIENSLSNMDVIQHQLNQISTEVESIKNPSLEDNVDNILKHSYPFNVKMSDFFNLDDEEQEPEIFKASPQEVESYNKEDIKNSFNS